MINKNFPNYSKTPIPVTVRIPRKTGLNRKQRRSEKADERRDPERKRQSKMRYNLHEQKIEKINRLLVKAETNRQRSALRRNNTVKA